MTGSGLVGLTRGLVARPAGVRDGSAVGGTGGTRAGRLALPAGPAAEAYAKHLAKGRRIPFTGQRLSVVAARRASRARAGGVGR
jgi:hypothetical protein